MGGIFSSITDFIGIDIETLITVFVIIVIIYIFLRRKNHEQFQNLYYPANPAIGVQPLILKNTEELPIITIRTSTLGKAGYFTANCIRKLVYPVDPVITYTDQNKLLTDLKADELAIVREQEILSSVTRENMSLVILAPLFYEYILCMTDKYSDLYNISDLTKLKRNGRNNVIGVLDDSLELFKTICKNRNLRLDLKDSSFAIANYKLESELFVDFGLKKLDAVFLVTHPKDTILQTYCNDNVVRFLDLEPFKIGTGAKPNIPFNPEDENTLDEFKTAMKRDVPWIFPVGMSVDKIPNGELSSVTGASRATGNISIQRHVYNTYKVRSLLCYKQLQSSLILSPGSKQLQGLSVRLIRQYQTMRLLFNKWNPVRGNDATADSTDVDSFEFNELATIPKTLQLADEIKQELKHVGLVKFDSEVACELNKF